LPRLAVATSESGLQACSITDDETLLIKFAPKTDPNRDAAVFSAEKTSKIDQSTVVSPVSTPSAEKSRESATLCKLSD
jgi:hypothetical protein